MLSCASKVILMNFVRMVSRSRYNQDWVTIRSLGCAQCVWPWAQLKTSEQFVPLVLFPIWLLKFLLTDIVHDQAREIGISHSDYHRWSDLEMENVCVKIQCPKYVLCCW
jgi:hypothetical protein